MSDSPLTFTASIAPLQSAIKIAHDGGARIALDIPESEMPAIVRLVLYRGQRIKVTIELDQQEETQVKTWRDPKV